MPGQPVKLGPFSGGLNSLSDPTALSDQELADIINFELDLDGSLGSRPPITSETTGITAHLRLLGYFINTDGTYYLLASNSTAGGTSNRTYYYTGGAWTAIANSCEAIAVVQFNDKMWLCANPNSASTTNSGWWTPAAGFTAVAAMPKGKAIIAHKNRLWVAPGKGVTPNGSRIRFSSVTDPTVWDTNNYLDVAAGDGQNVTDIVVYQNSLMIFKNDSTYVFSYDSAPDRGTISRISATQGASDINCVVPFENVLFVYHEGNVYELINYNYTRINIKVPFTTDNSYVGTWITTVALSIFNERLIIRHFDRVYVYNLRTRTWSRWDSGTQFAYFIVEPKNNLVTDIPTAYATSVLSSGRNLLRIRDVYDNVSTESMACYLKTKNYDYQTPNFKKLFWWGADIVASGDVDVIANPIVYKAEISWDQLVNTATGWDAIQTWDQPLEALPVVTDGINAAGAGKRRFIKFLKALRFRQIFFEVTIDNDGSIATAPAKVFNLVTYVSTKAHPVQKIS
jgi:hypothetical protein